MVKEVLRSYRYQGRHHRAVEKRDAADVVAGWFNTLGAFLVTVGTPTWRWLTRYWVEGGLITSMITLVLVLLSESRYAPLPTPTIVAPSAVVVTLTLPTPFPTETQEN